MKMRAVDNIDKIDIIHKNSAVAEMGDRGHNRHEPKRGELCPFLEVELGPRLT